MAIIFVLAMIPIMGLIGAAIDYSRGSALRARLLAALDAAVLAAAVSPGSDDNVRQKAFQQSFQAHFLGADATTKSATLDLSTPGFIKGFATATIDTTFAKVIGVNSLDIGVVSEARMGVGASEIVMALDVSGSMFSPDLSGRSRIDVLREAAVTLIDAASSTSAPGKLKIGYVPFTMNVNIGLANAAYVDGTSDPLFSGTSWAGCVLERGAPNHLSTAYSASNKFRAYIWPPETDSVAALNPGNGSNTGYRTIDPLLPLSTSDNANTHGPNYNCVRHPMAPLTTDMTTLKSKINTLTAPGNWGTLLTPGVVWGMRLLTPNAPFPGADAFGGTTRKSLVVLTDGEQTTDGRAGYTIGANTTGIPYAFDPTTWGLSGRVLGPNAPEDTFTGYGYLYDSDPFGYTYGGPADLTPSLNKLLLEACGAAKKLGVEVYTVAVSNAAGPGTSVHDTLLACASDPSHFFFVTDAASMNAAFASIGKGSTAFVRTRWGTPSSRAAGGAALATTRRSAFCGLRMAALREAAKVNGTDATRPLFMGGDFRHMRDFS